MKHYKKLTSLALGLAALGLAALPANAAIVASWDGGTGNFADANWTVDGTPSQNHAAFTTDAFTTTINGGTVNNFNNALTGDLGDTDTNLDSLTITGGASVNGDFIRVRKIGGGSDFSNVVTLENGSMTFSDANVFRTDNMAFTGLINFTGAAGSAFIAQTNLTGTSNQHMANKISAGTGNAFSFFSIDGTMVASGEAYNGTNLGAVNTGLATQIVNGRYFEILESGGTQTLTLVAVPEPSAFALLAGIFGLTWVMLRRRA